jgi:hypothetical protein
MIVMTDEVLYAEHGAPSVFDCETKTVQTTNGMN